MNSQVICKYNHFYCFLSDFYASYFFSLLYCTCTGFNLQYYTYSNGKTKNSCLVANHRGKFFITSTSGMKLYLGYFVVDAFIGLKKLPSIPNFLSFYQYLMWLLSNGFSVSIDFSPSFILLIWWTVLILKGKTNFSLLGYPQLGLWWLILCINLIDKGYPASWQNIISLCVFEGKYF